MFFSFKKKEVVIDAFTVHKDVHDFFPIELATNFIPDWWKKIPKNQELKNDFVDSVPTMTMRHCSGIIDYFKNGFILPMWSDVKVKTSFESVTYQFSSDFCKFETHGNHQHNSYFSDYHHLKFSCPWHLKNKSDEKFLCTMPTWNLKSFWEKMFILPGVLEFKFNSAVHVNAFLKKENDFLFIEAGTPLYYISPLTEQKIKIVKHLVTEAELQKNVYGNPFFTNKRSKMRSFYKGTK